MSATAVRSPTEYESQLQRYLFERSEEGRAVRVGEKEVSEQAAIVARYADLFSRDQLDVPREPDPIARSEEEKGISLRELERALVAASEATAGVYATLRDRWFDRLLGSDREQVPSSNHVSYLRRLTPLDATYTRERSVPVCL